MDPPRDLCRAALPGRPDGPEGPSSIAGIVLAGGRSARMGWPKATLPFGPELMLQRVVRLLGSAVQPIVVVAARGQELPALPPGVSVARDEREGCGPLEGLLAGLLAVETLAEAAYVTSCDVPLLSPAFVRAMAERLGAADIAVAVEGEFPHPLAGVYRVRVLPQIRELLAAGDLRLSLLLDRARTIRVPADELRSADPSLATLRNLNRPADYLAALNAAGFKPDPAAALERPGT